jgi:hypothetical protein
MYLNWLDKVGAFNGSVLVTAGGASGVVQCVAGQMGFLVRYIAGCSLEFGGPSLTPGNGFVMGGAVHYTPIPIIGDLYYTATGTTTCTWSFLRVFSEGNPGSGG